LLEFQLLDFKGIKSTFLSALGILGLFFGLIHFEALWQDKLTIINYLVFPLLIITAVFATQFNRSRIAILCLLWGLYLISEHSTFTWSKWLVGNSQWLLLCGASLLLLLAFMKDRAIFSVHTLTRVVLIVFCGGITFAWLKVSGSFIELFPNTETWKQITPYIPIFFPLRVIGIVLLWRSLRNHDLTQTILLVTFVVWYLNQLHVITLPWSVIAVAMSSIYLLAVSTDSYYLAYRDDLTSLPTRRALNQLALSLGRKYTVAMLDIDHFKKFNDTYGHDIGDQVLKLVAAKMAGVKGGGKIYRYGGEEFTVVFPRKSIEQAIPELDALRESIATYDMVIRNPKRTDKNSRKSKKPSDYKTVNVTVSIGVAQREPKQTFDQALKNADLALYRAKKNGRNNVSK
jgi:diguanylate cyclase (GGDEF)-like protein